MIDRTFVPPLNVAITRERPDSPDAAGLIAELEAVLNPLYPPASRHGYSVDKLLAQGVAFYVLRAGGLPAGCGGILLVDNTYGELKRMYVRPEYRGRGYGRLLIDALAAHAVANGITVLRLETGIHQQEAIRLYEGKGFYRIPPFGPYFEDPVSLCYEKRLT